MKQGILFYFFWMIAVVAVAQTTHYSFQHLQTRQGLSDGRIHSITQDKYGFLWITTNHGLNRFNGYTVENYVANSADTNSIPHMITRKILTSGSGNLYVSTQGGFCLYDYEKNNFKRNPFGINFQVVSMVEAEPGMIWMSTSKGIIILNEKKGVYAFLADHKDSSLRKIARVYVHDFTVDKDRNLYMATPQGLYVLNLNSCKVTVFQNDPKDPGSISSNEVRNVEVDQDGVVWASTRYYGSTLEKYDKVKKKFTHYHEFHDEDRGWADNRIMDLLTDRNGNLWIVSIRSGMTLRKKGSDHFNYFFRDPMLSNSVSTNSLINLFEDNNGIIWIGTDGYGVDYFQPSNDHFVSIRQSFFQQPTLADNACRAVAEDENGNLWIGTYKGISFLDRNQMKYTNYLLAESEVIEANNSIRAVLTDVDGSVWIGTGEGLNKWSPDTRRIEPVNEKDSIPVIYINHLYKDKSNNIWVSTVRGLYVYHRETHKFENVLKRPELKAYSNRRATNIYQDSRGKFWIDLPGYGVLVYDEAHRTSEFLDAKFLHKQSTNFNYISSFGEDSKGIMWMTAIQGLIGMNMSTREIQYFEHHHGKQIGRTSGLLVDSLDRLWIGTSNGLLMLDRDRKEFYRFDEYDGLPSRYFYEGTAQKLNNGNFAYSTYEGVVLFNPNRIRPEKREIPVYLTAFRLQGDDKSNLISTGSDSRLKLRYDQNYFNVEMTALDFNNPTRIRYAYMLEGFDEDWRYTSERLVSYTNVPGGTYTFRYKAAPYPDVDAAPEKQLPVVVGTVFYKSWWFLFPALLLISLLLYFIIRWKLNQQNHIHFLQTRAESLEKEKAMVMYENLQQQLNPHFLFNSLTSLRSLIKINPTDAGNFLDRMSTIYRYILQNRDNELVSLKDELNFVQSFIDLQKTRFRDGLKVTIEIPEECHHLKIVPVTLQNLIENAIKHNLVDEDTPLTIEMFIENNYLVIRNNLQKKDFVDSSNKQGLKNLTALYEYMEERKVVVNEDEKYFSVSVPLIP